MRSFINKLNKKINFFTTLLQYLLVKDSWKALKKADVLLIAHENDRSFLFLNKCYSPILDTIRFYLEEKGVLCTGVSKPFDRRKYSDNYYQDKTINRIFLGNYLLSKLLAFVTQKKYGEIKEKREIFIWTKILLRVNPKTVFSIQPSESLCIACHQLSITIYELQHGVISNNSYYSNSLNVKKDKKKLPIGYLCWDDYSADYLNLWCITRNIAVIKLGNPWYYRFQKKENHDQLVQSILSPYPFSSKKKCILITLQWSLDVFYPNFFTESDLIHPVLLEAMNKLGNTVNWLIRLHPVQMKNPNIIAKVQSLFPKNQNVEIYWATTQPLPLVLGISDAHVTWDSSSVIDASLFNLKSYVLNPTHFTQGFYADSHHPHHDVELPYAKYELVGLVTRSQNIPNTLALIDWLKNVNLNDKLLLTEPLFDKEILCKLALS